MLWKIPPKVKVLEALGCIGDNRIVIDDGNPNRAIVKSSNLDKEYYVSYYPEKNKVYSTDNASKFRHYIGYPIIAFLMKKGVINFDNKIANALKGIKWNELNKKFKRDYSKTEEYAKGVCEKKGFKRELVDKEVEGVLKQLKNLRLEY